MRSFVAGLLVVAGTIAMIVAVLFLEPVPFMAGFVSIVVGAVIEVAPHG